VFLSVVALRGALTRHWVAFTFAALATALLQTPAARPACPPLRPGRTRGDRFC
jgi:hypothetical protein